MRGWKMRRKSLIEMTCIWIRCRRRRIRQDIIRLTRHQGFRAVSRRRRWCITVWTGCFLNRVNIDVRRRCFFLTHCSLIALLTTLFVQRSFSCRRRMLSEGTKNSSKTWWRWWHSIRTKKMWRGMRGRTRVCSLKGRRVCSWKDWRRWRRRRRRRNSMNHVQMRWCPRHDTWVEWSNCIGRSWLIGWACKVLEARIHLKGVCKRIGQGIQTWCCRCNCSNSCRRSSCFQIRWQRIIGKEGRWWSSWWKEGSLQGKVV